MLRHALIALALSVLPAAVAAPPQSAQEPRPLRILVANDDGIDSKGLTTLVRELAAPGVPIPADEGCETVT